MNRFLKPDPLGLPRNPLAIFLLALAFFSGLLLLGGVNTAGRVEQVLPHPVLVAWGAVLTVGSGMTLLGMFWPGSVATGILCKRFGMLALTIASFVYSTVLVSLLGFAALLPAGVTVGFGWACAVQYRQINERVREIIRASRDE